jgi:hypothetical protein
MDFPQQQWLRERASVLRFTYITLSCSLALKARMPVLMLGRRYKKHDPQLVSVERILALLTETNSREETE